VHVVHHDGTAGGQRQPLGSVSCSELVVERPPAVQANELLNDDADVARIDRERGGGPGSADGRVAPRQRPTPRLYRRLSGKT